MISFYWIQFAFNLSDMLSKHWDHPTVYPMILKAADYKRKHYTCLKGSNTRKENENLKMQPERVKKKEKQE